MYTLKNSHIFEVISYVIERMIGIQFLKLLNPLNSSRLLKKSVSKFVLKINYCSANVGTIGNFSLFNAKKTIKLSATELEDGFTCLRTFCPVCDTQKKDTHFFINKITGN